MPAILDLYEIPYTFSDPLVMALCLHKGLTKTAVAHAGVPTTPFALVESIADVETVDLPFPLFAKPVAEGTGKGINAESKIKDREALRRVCGRLLAQCRQPVIVETFLPGREFTVGILGTGGEARVIGSMEIISCRRPRRRSIRTIIRPAGKIFASTCPGTRPRMPKWPRPNGSPWPPIARWAAATPPASISAPTATAARISWRSTRSPGCTPKIPTCR